MSAPAAPKTKKPPKATTSPVLGWTTDGIAILKQGRSKHFTQKEALAAARKVVAARTGK